MWATLFNEGAALRRGLGVLFSFFHFLPPLEQKSHFISWTVHLGGCTNTWKWHCFDVRYFCIALAKRPSLNTWCPPYCGMALGFSKSILKNAFCKNISSMSSFASFVLTDVFVRERYDQHRGRTDVLTCMPIAAIAFLASYESHSSLQRCPLCCTMFCKIPKAKDANLFFGNFAHSTYIPPF